MRAMTVRTALAPLAAVPVLLAACAGDTEAQIAADACDVLEEVLAEGPEGMMDGERMAEFQEEFGELEDRAEEADVSNQDIDAAMREECPEILDELDDMRGPQVTPGDPDEDEVVGEPEDDGE